MAATFVDSSCLVALALEEPDAGRVAALLDDRRQKEIAAALGFETP
jgi:uncharacterized protein with PIN domain